MRVDHRRAVSVRLEMLRQRMGSAAHQRRVRIADVVDEARQADAGQQRILRSDRPSAVNRHPRTAVIRAPPNGVVVTGQRDRDRPAGPSLADP